MKLHLSKACHKRGGSSIKFDKILAPSKHIEISDIDEATESGMDDSNSFVVKQNMDLGSSLDQRLAYATASDYGDPVDSLLRSLRDMVEKKGLLLPVPESGLSDEELKTRLASLNQLNEYRREHKERVYGRVAGVLHNLFEKMRKQPKCNSEYESQKAFVNTRRSKSYHLHSMRTTARNPSATSILPPPAHDKKNSMQSAKCVTPIVPKLKFPAKKNSKRPVIVSDRNNIGARDALDVKQKEF